MRSIRYAPVARHDLDEIFTWIATDNPISAEDVLNRIIVTVEDLAQFSTGRPGTKPGTFEKIVKGLPYVVIYAVDIEPDDHDTVTVLYVQHMARDVRW